MPLERRLARLEAERQTVGERRLRAALMERGLSQAEAQAGAVTLARAEREAPPVPAPGGKVDVEPTLRRLAGLHDFDPDALVEEMRRQARDEHRTWD